MASFVAVNATSYQVQHSPDCITTLDFSNAMMPKTTLSKWGEVSMLKEFVGPNAVQPVLQSGTEISQNFGPYTFSWNVVTDDPGNVFTFDGGGGIELLIILNSKPSSNVFTFPINLSSLNAYLQPLTVQGGPNAAFADAQRSPGSIAFYHATRSNFHPDPVTAARFRCCQAFMLYACVAQDATGKTLVIPWTISGNSLILTLDQNWLAAATYPVTIDPTFGYTTQGSSTDANPPGCYFFAHQTPSSSGTLTSISLDYCQEYTGSSGDDFGSALYANGTGSPSQTGAYVSGSATYNGNSIPSSYGNVTGGTVSVSITSGTQYWFSIAPSNGSSSLNTTHDIQYYYNVISDNGSQTFDYTSTPPSTFPSGTPTINGNVEETPALFGTYTASGAGFLNTDYWWQQSWIGGR